MKKHILVVDDEAPIRDLLEEFLTRSGYRVTAVDSAVAAQRVVREDPPNLVISDLQLEDSDGLAMIDGFKATLPQVPMMLLTGVLFDPQVVRAMGQKISAYLQKTSSLTQILAEVKRLIGDA